MHFDYRWTAAEQQKYAEEKLCKYVRDYIYPFHPYYRKMMKEKRIDPENICTLQDFRRDFPVTEKQDTLEDQKSFVLQPKLKDTRYDVEPLPKEMELQYALKTLITHYNRDILGKKRPFKEKVKQTAMYEWLPMHFTFSGGSTGVPSSSVYTARDIRKNMIKGLNMGWISGTEPQRRTLSLFPAVPHLAFFAAITLNFFGDNGVSSPYLHTCGGKAVPTERQVVIASLLGFEAIMGIPSYILYWLKTAVEMKNEGMIDGIRGVEYLFAGAEPVTDEFRARVKGYLEELGSPGVKISSVYGMTEMKCAFLECDEKTGVHLNPEFYYWELLDPESREPVKEGEPGVLVFSHIDWRGTVFLRYWTGDLIQGGMVWGKCADCGITAPRIYAPIARAVKDFTKIKGARVPLLNFQTALHRIKGLDAWQVVICKQDEADPLSRDRLVVYASLEPDAGGMPVREQIMKNVLMEAEVSPDEIIFEDAGSLEKRLFERTGLKADWVVDRRDITLTPEDEKEKEPAAN